MGLESSTLYKSTALGRYPVSFSSQAQKALLLSKL